MRSIPAQADILMCGVGGGGYSLLIFAWMLAAAPRGLLCMHACVNLQQVQHAIKPRCQLVQAGNMDTTQIHVPGLLFHSKYSLYIVFSVYYIGKYAL